ncbi:hypothetical protein PPERSA_05353 [Pseudocohnilembus persalinus]|uniref:Insulin-like growth factor binding protein, N-terminal n=1 Tax=Pseudocohnilembus persalinus TaxID=266149 RepID=A0A0V0R663_PSEPJ|nr:hypothetical protein PPERSA_05353 [Pseudocohnilembus persalinus]|eukprot:KRX09961.1 hypothetical protein PPERSA_05353 [Pseudocohnilembus persalinus]
MRNIKVSYLKYKIKIVFLCWIISLFNLVQCIQLDTTQWQEVDKTNDYIRQSFIQYSGYSRVYDSLQLSQTKYANLIRSYDQSDGKILIQVLDEYGNQQCSKKTPVQNYLKYSLTNTNVEGEFFLGFTSYQKVFFGFLDKTCNFSRGLSASDQPDDFTTISFLSILAKTGKDNVYIVSQTWPYPYYLYLMILDIFDTTTYSIKKHVKLGTTDFRYNLFSIQAFSDDYAVIFARDTNDKLQKITIDSIGNQAWDKPKDQGIFLDLNTNYNYVQNKAILIENTNKYSIVTGDITQDIFTIYTFQYNRNGEIQDICLETYENQFGSMGSQFFYALEFGVINQDFVWVKGDNQNDNRKTVIFFTNPLDCQVYRNPDDSSIYQYQLKHFSRSHIFHTYYSNQTVTFIASSSWIDGSNNQNLQAIRISIEVCKSFNMNYIFEGYWSNENCYENYYKPDIIQKITDKCKIKLNSDYFYCKDQSDSKKITSLNQNGEFISCNQDCFPCHKKDMLFKLEIKKCV